MTLEQLFKIPPKFKTLGDYLESLTDAELETHFAPYLNVTRPERVTQESKPTNTKPSSKKVTQTDAYKERAKFLAEQYGIKLNL